MPSIEGIFRNLKMNYLKLKAQRQGLGLTVAEIAEIAKVTKRSFQYWEAGKVPVPHDLARWGHDSSAASRRRGCRHIQYTLQISLSGFSTGKTKKGRINRPL